MPATPTKRQSKPAAKPAKPAAKAKAAPAKPAKPSKPAKAKSAKKEFPLSAAEQAASDDKFYSALEKHGMQTMNPRTNKRLGRFILVAHCLAQCWPTKPKTAAEIAADCSAKFGIKVSAARVERQLVDEIRCGRAEKAGKGYRKTGETANYWSLATE